MEIKVKVTKTWEEDYRVNFFVTDLENFFSKNNPKKPSPSLEEAKKFLIEQKPVDVWFPYGHVILSLE